jgi:diketogulonate reductase-like aldo/keto reductase
VSEQIASSFRTSLANLHTTYIDSYILHSPLQTLELTLEAWHTLGALQDTGKVGMIGVSNTYDVNVLEALQKVRKVDVGQNRWYQGNDWDKEVCKYCKVNGIQYQLRITLTNVVDLPNPASHLGHSGL